MKTRCAVGRGVRALRQGETAGRFHDHDDERQTHVRMCTEGYTCGHKMSQARLLEWHPRVDIPHFGMQHLKVRVEEGKGREGWRNFNLYSQQQGLAIEDTNSSSTLRFVRM